MRIEQPAKISPAIAEHFLPGGCTGGMVAHDDCWAIASTAQANRYPLAPASKIAQTQA